MLPAGNRHPSVGVTLSRMKTLTRRIALALTLVGLMGTAAACAPSEAAVAPSVMVAAGTLIDVRTPQEFAEGHLEGAINIPVELPTFAAQVAELDPDVEYLVYCRSGRRADVALDLMGSIGLSGVNLGSVEQASTATGISIVR
jgi:phage shock protein E